MPVGVLSVRRYCIRSVSCYDIRLAAHLYDRLSYSWTQTFCKTPTGSASKCTLLQCVDITWLLSTAPVPTASFVDTSINPDRSVLYHAVRVIHYELLKRLVSDLVCDDWQRWIPSLTKLSRFIPTQHRTTRVETIALSVHLVTFGHLDCVYEADRQAYVAYTCGNRILLPSFRLFE